VLWLLVYFNPRTHEECDPCLIFLSQTRRYFNPRTHEECDVTVCAYGQIALYISIHALTRSATW